MLIIHRHEEGEEFADDVATALGNIAGAIERGALMATGVVENSPPSLACTGLMLYLKVGYADREEETIWHATETESVCVARRVTDGVWELRAPGATEWIPMHEEIKTEENGQCT
jgi:hypothetical protein